MTMFWQWKLQHQSWRRRQWMWQTKWRQRPRNWRRNDQMVTEEQMAKFTRRGQWRAHKNRQFCMDWWWDWTSAETTTSAIDSESGLSEYADIWCTKLYNECGGGKLVMGKEYPQTKWEYEQIVKSRLRVICQQHWHAVNWKERWPWFVSTSKDVTFEVVLYSLYKLPIRWQVLTWTLQPVKVWVVSLFILPLCLSRKILKYSAAMIFLRT